MITIINKTNLTQSFDTIGQLAAFTSAQYDETRLVNNQPLAQQLAIAVSAGVYQVVYGGISLTPDQILSLALNLNISSSSKYSPAVPTSWVSASQPASVADGLDQLVSRVSADVAKIYLTSTQAGVNGTQVLYTPVSATETGFITVKGVAQASANAVTIQFQFVVGYKFASSTMTLESAVTTVYLHNSSNSALIAIVANTGSIQANLNADSSNALNWRIVCEIVRYPIHA